MLRRAGSAPHHHLGLTKAIAGLVVFALRRFVVAPFSIDVCAAHVLGSCKAAPVCVCVCGDGVTPCRGAAGVASCFGSMVLTRGDSVVFRSGSFCERLSTLCLLCCVLHCLTSHADFPS